jgi:hypothetical protein
MAGKIDHDKLKQYPIIRDDHALIRPDCALIAG